MQIDMRVLELLASKLCHDLISPVSAINNGVELIEDIGGSVADEAMKLIGDSAVQASRRLRLYRLAYGRAGNEDNLAAKDVRQVAEQYILGGKTTLSWPEDQPAPAFIEHRGFLKALLNLLVLSEEILAYGGAISVHAHDDGCRIEVAGRSAHLSPPLAAALEGAVPVEELTPRTIQAYIAGRFAGHFGLRLGYDQSVADRLELILSVSPGH